MATEWFEWSVEFFDIASLTQHTKSCACTGHCVAQLHLILRVVPPKGLTQPLSNLFLVYVQRFDVVPQLNPKLSSRAGPFPEPATSMFVLKQAVRASRTMLGDIIPLTQIRALADLVPRFGAQADPRLTKQASLAYSNELWLNKYFDKETFFALHLLYVRQ